MKLSAQTSFNAEGATSWVAANANVVMQRVINASLSVGRNSDSVKLVAVSKTKPVEDIQSLYDAGFRHFGENYVQELLEKANLLPSDICWHFIGHLQSSKASKIVKDVPNLAIVESVDTQKLATKLNNACQSAGRSQLKIFIQVDTSGEATKCGVDDGTELVDLVSFIKDNCPFLNISGLMTIGAVNDSSCFDKLVNSRLVVAELLNVNSNSLELSMGMSGDFETAIEKGATSVRIGSTIFGPRLYLEK